MKKIKYLITLSFILIIQGLYAEKENTFSELNGKRIAVIGDSYVKNHNQPIEYTWHYKFAKKHGMEYLNFGRNGNCIAYDRARFGEAMYKRYTSMPDSLDYILVIAGHNDSSMLDSMGGIEVFKEKLDILCKGLINKYPSAKILFFTRWTCQNFQNSHAEMVVNTMVETCGKYSIPIFDCARKGGMYAANESFRKLYYIKSTDDAHLNAKGHDRFLKVAENFILQY